MLFRKQFFKQNGAFLWNAVQAQYTYKINLKLEYAIQQNKRNKEIVPYYGYCTITVFIEIILVNVIKSESV